MAFRFHVKNAHICKGVMSRSVPLVQEHLPKVLVKWRTVADPVCAMCITMLGMVMIQIGMGLPN